MRRATARTVLMSSDGNTKIRATISLPGPTSGTTLVTSSAPSQLMIAPSASRPAKRSIPGRRPATRIGGGTSGGRPSRKPLIVKVSKAASTFSPVKAWRRKRTRSRVRLYGSSKGMSFHRSTMTLDEVPTPRANFPGAASARAAALWARSAGPRV